MGIKDGVVSWYIKNVLIPSNEVFDIPGFVLCRVSKKNRVIQLREVVLPEDLFVDVERKVVEVFEEKGEKALYRIGKTFGKYYAAISDFPVSSKTKRKDFEDFCFFLTKYIASTWSSNSSFEIDFENKLYFGSFEDYIVCRKSGVGKIFKQGGIAGIWAHMIEDINSECVQKSCQGRGDRLCQVVAGPVDKLNHGETVFLERNIKQITGVDSRYESLNSVKPTQYGKKSLKDLLDLNMFSYKEGFLTFKNGERFFNIDSHFVPMLEEELSKLPNGSEFLFEICFVYGKIIGRGLDKTSCCPFISNFLSATGFGDAYFNLNLKRVTINFFPFFSSFLESTFVVIRGLLSGIVSEALGEDIKFLKFRTKILDSMILVVE